MTTKEIRLNVEKALDEIRPFLQSDGGDISLIAIEDDKYDASIMVDGGGHSGQVDAIKNGIAKALVIKNESLKGTLKKADQSLYLAKAKGRNCTVIFDASRALRHCNEPMDSIV